MKRKVINLSKDKEILKEFEALIQENKMLYNFTCFEFEDLKSGLSKDDTEGYVYYYKGFYIFEFVENYYCKNFDIALDYSKNYFHTLHSLYFETDYKDMYLDFCFKIEDNEFQDFEIKKLNQLKTLFKVKNF